VVAGLLVSCGSSDASSGDTLPVPGAVAQAQSIEVSADSELARMLDTAAPSELFEAAPGLAVEPGMAGRWEVSSMPATLDEAEALAALFDVAGEVVADESGFGAELVVGSFDEGSSAVTVTSASQPFWSLARPDTYLVESGAIPCPTVAIDDPASGECANGVEPATPTAPTESIIESTVAEVMAGLGVGPDSFRTDVFESGGVAEVRVEFTPDGVRSNESWSLTISGSGEVTSGSGPLRPPVLVDEVRTVSLDEALVRLSRALPGLPANAVPPPSTGDVTTPPTTAVDADNVITIAPSTVPATVVFPRITDAEPGLVEVWDITNRQWLVPALVLTGDGGFTTAVPVISADFVTVVDPSLQVVPVRTGPPLTIPTPPPTTLSIPETSLPPVPAASGEATTATTTTVVSQPGDQQPLPTLPVPPEPGTDPTEIPAFYNDVLNELLIGEPLDSAWVRLLDAGWDVRVDDLDDPTETFEADLRIDRVTIQHRGIDVIAIVVG